MNSLAAEPSAAPRVTAGPTPRGRLFRKYVALFVAVVCAALVANGLPDIWFSFREQNVLLARIQQDKAEAVAAKIGQFIKEIEYQLGGMTQLPWSVDMLDEWGLDAARLMHQAPAVTELAQVDAAGREQIRVSRLVEDVVCSEADYSQDPAFVEAMGNKIYYGAVRFVDETEPYMTLAMAGIRRDYGVIVARVNLKFIWDVVSQIQVGVRGRAYVVDAAGRLIAHPDISMVLRNTVMSHLKQVQAARAESSAASGEQFLVTNDIEGQEVLSVHAPVAPIGWMVFVDLPVDEAYGPLYNSIRRSGTLLLAALLVAALAGLYLARRMTKPIRALRDGAVRIGQGDLDQRIAIETGDELEALGNQFNSMAAQLQDSYASLERKVDERTRQLELANLAKSRFLAVASHDLRQPLHALGLFVAQLRAASSPSERAWLIDRMDTAIVSTNELFNALLDISRIDAGALTPKLNDFPLRDLLKRIETTFSDTAEHAGLTLRVVQSDAWVRSDSILLEQILLNLLSNALRYTSRGGSVLGCRKRGRQLRIEVWDSGPGIPEDQRQKIFGEFYRLDNPQHDKRGGLGLGLAIVDRLCRLLGHPIELDSIVGRGSRFAVLVPMASPRAKVAALPIAAVAALDVAVGKVIAVIDDDPLALDGMSGLLRTWNCNVIAGRSANEVLLRLGGSDRPVPDLIISDFQLSDGITGLQVIEQLRAKLGTPIPAFLVSGDIGPATQKVARDGGYHLLHKPVDPMSLRALINRMLRKKDLASACR
jgi:signal transduction histidine kinase/CheY-like chemotaxis protein